MNRVLTMDSIPYRIRPPYALEIVKIWSYQWLLRIS